MPCPFRRVRALRTLVLCATLVGVSGCITIFYDVETDEVDPAKSPEQVSTPVKAHLSDGSIALFRDGATFTGDSIRGDGWQYGLMLDDSTRVDGLALDSIVALEAYRESVRPTPSLLVSTVATAGAALGTAMLAMAAFGSCPTVYSQGDSLTLEAESFSNSIVPLFEMRDVDALAATADADGALTLEIRNEALETHYINHLELSEVQHAPDETAIPAAQGRAWIVGDLRMPPWMHDQSGRDVAAVLAEADGNAYRTPAALLEAVDTTRFTDHIDLALPAPPTDTVVVVLRLRNSLLNTLLLYDYMLAGQGARSLEWLGKDLNVISTAIELGDFYRRRMGLRVQVQSRSGYQTVGRVRDVGPVAWSREAVPVPVPVGVDSLRLRLSFVADAWRIDRVAVAHRARPAVPDQHPLAAVRTPGHAPDSAMARLGAPDHDYWITLPTDRFWATFQPGSKPLGTERTFFLAAQGYYTEWIRRNWLDAPLHIGPSGRFQMDDGILAEAIRAWRVHRPAFEAEFEASKLPVR
jgi:hypothetical protein